MLYIPSQSICQRSEPNCDFHQFVAYHSTPRVRRAIAPTAARTWPGMCGSGQPASMIQAITCCGRVLAQCSAERECGLPFVAPCHADNTSSANSEIDDWHARACPGLDQLCSTVGTFLVTAGTVDDMERAAEYVGQARRWRQVATRAGLHSSSIA